MTACEERRRFDAAMKFVSEALPRVSQVFKGGQKIENIILAYKYLEAANKILGKDIIASTVTGDPEVRNLLDVIDREVADLAERIEGSSTVATGEDGNIIDIKF